MANSEEHIIEILNNFDKIIFRGKNDETVENFGTIIKKLLLLVLILINTQLII